MLLLDPQTLEPAKEQRLLLHEVSWEEYERLSDSFVDSFPRMAYLEGTLEILMATSPEHERLKTIIARLIEIFALEKRLELNGYGSATFRRRAAKRGAEPDECYCLGPLQEVPDIVIEVVLTSGGIDKLEVYRGLQVPEVWFFQNDRFALYRLREEKYEAIARSTFLPDLDFSSLEKFVGYANQTEAIAAFRDSLMLNK